MNKLVFTSFLLFSTTDMTFFKNSNDKTWIILGEITKKNHLIFDHANPLDNFLGQKIKEKPQISDLLNFSDFCKVSSKMKEIIRNGSKTLRIGSYI